MTSAPPLKSWLLRHAYGISGIGFEEITVSPGWMEIGDIPQYMIEPAKGSPWERYKAGLLYGLAVFNSLTETNVLSGQWM